MNAGVAERSVLRRRGTLVVACRIYQQLQQQNPKHLQVLGGGRKGESFRLVQGGGAKKTSLLRVHKSRSKRREASEVAACGWTPLKVLLGDAQSLGKNKFGCAIFGSNCQEIEHILQLQQQLVLLVLLVLMLILILTLMSIVHSPVSVSALSLLSLSHPHHHNHHHDKMSDLLRWFPPLCTF